jgi:plasmid maintenance system antidote protein VapI
MHSLAVKAGVDDLAVQKIVGRKGDIALASAEKLFNALSLGLVRDSEGARTDNPSSLREVIRSAIAASGLTASAIGESSSVLPMHIRRIILAQGDIKLATADRLAQVLGLKVVSQVVALTPVPKPPTAPLSDALRSAIEASGLTANALAKACGREDYFIGKFLDRKGDLMLTSVDKLFSILGLGVVRDSKAASDFLPQTPSEAIRSAIEASGLTMYAVARKADVDCESTRKFFNRESDVTLKSADKLFDDLALKVVRDASARRPEPKPPLDDPLKRIADALRLAIIERGLGVNALAKRSGLSSAAMSRFINGKRNLSFIVAIKLAKALGIELGTVPLQPPSAEVSSSAGVPSSKVCPVKLRGDGHPIRVYGKEVPPLTGIAYVLAEFAVERFHQGGECFGAELATRTGTKRPIRLLMLKLEQPRFSPLARVLIWDARKGGTLRIIDPGPPGHQVD